jgi:hypothetical protein
MSARSVFKCIEEESTFEELHSELLSQYPNQYAAIYQQELVDHDADELILAERVDSRYPGEIVLIRQIRAEPEPPNFQNTIRSTIIATKSKKR